MIIRYKNSSHIKLQISVLPLGVVTLPLQSETTSYAVQH